MNPKNSGIFNGIVSELPFGPLEHFAPSPFNSIPVVMSEHIPERDLREQWCPPEDDRFCGYGPEDEYWMRPLGLGTIKTIDVGPLLLAIEDKWLKSLDNLMFTSPPQPNFTHSRMTCSTAHVPSMLSFKQMVRNFS